MRKLLTVLTPPGVLAVVLFITFPLVSYPQQPESCAEKLRSAQSGFSRGQLDQIPQLLSGCLRSGFKKEEEILAYKLLIQTYMLNDRVEAGDSVMLEFLRKNPEYRISETDHSSFVNIYNGFNVNSLIMLSIRLGTSYPFLTFVDEHPMNMIITGSEFEKDASNFYLSVEARYRFAPRFEASADIGYSQLQFRNSGKFMSPEEGYPVGEYSYTENQKRLEIPLSVTYEITTFAKSLSPYARGGLGIALNISTTANAGFDNYYNLLNDLTSGNLNRNDSRSFADIFVHAGAGMRFKIPRGYFFGEVRSAFGMLNQYTEGGATENELQQHYKWHDPDFRLNSITFCAGYTYIFYKPSKKTVKP